MANEVLVCDFCTQPTYATRDGSSIYGVHDTIGNVFEWITDVWPDGRNSPMYKSTGWDVSVKKYASLAVRGAIRSIDDSWNDSGFRCARDVP